MGGQSTSYCATTAGEELRQLRARVEKIEMEAEIERRVRERLAERERQAEEAAAVQPRRSQMSAKGKSDYIRELGIEKYNALDW